MASTEDDDEASDGLGKLKLDPTTNIPVRNNHRVRDITREFNAASKALEIGQLVKDEGFSLFDSVQALEIMDPKMDTGLLEPGETLDDDYDVSQNLLPAEVVWIMDQLLCYEMAWHQGYPLAQNLLTSMHIYNLLVQERLPNATPFFRPLDGTSTEPGPLVQKVLRAFCIGIIKTCDVVIEIIQTQQYYEEEDFNTHTFGLNLLTDIPDNEFFNLCSDAMQWLESSDGQKHMNPHLNTALLSRLSCREHFLRLILPNQPDNPNADAESFAFRALAFAIGSEESGVCREAVQGAFSSKLQRRLASTVPPRPIVTLDIRTASANLRKMYTDIEEALKADRFGRQTTIDNLANFLWSFSAREASAFPRAVLQMFVFNEGKIAGPGDGIQSLLITRIRYLLHESQGGIQERFWDVEVPTDPRFQVARAVDFFLEQAAPEYINVLRSLCQNRCRIWRCLTNVVRDVDSLQTDLETHFGKDTMEPSKNDFASLIKHGLLLLVQDLLSQAIEWAVELGFEQEIYQPSEFAGLQHYMTLLGNERHISHGSFWNKADGSKTEIERITRTQYKSRENIDHASHNLWWGLSMLYAALTRLDAMPPPKTPYAAAQAQFELRMRPFASLVHAPKLSFDSFVLARDLHNISLDELLTLAATELLAARTRASARVRAKPISGNYAEGLGDLVAGITGNSEAWVAQQETAALKACVRAAVGVEALRRGLRDVGGEEDKLRGRVTVTMETPVLGRPWLVPSIVVTK